MGKEIIFSFLLKWYKVTFSTRRIIYCNDYVAISVVSLSVFTYFRQWHAICFVLKPFHFREHSRFCDVNLSFLFLLVVIKWNSSVWALLQTGKALVLGLFHLELLGKNEHIKKFVFVAGSRKYGQNISWRCSPVSQEVWTLRHYTRNCMWPLTLTLPCIISLCCLLYG